MDELLMFFTNQSRIMRVLHLYEYMHQNKISFSYVNLAIALKGLPHAFCGVSTIKKCCL